MDKETQLWNQYASLREEIKAADALCFQILGIIVGAVTTILATSIGQSDPMVRFFAFLCVYVVTIPGYRLIAGKRSSIWRISTYTRTFLEPELQFVKWETRISQQQAKVKNDTKQDDVKNMGGENLKPPFSSFVITNEWFILSGLNWLAAVAAIFGGLLQANIELLAQIAGTLAVLMLNALLTWRLSVAERSLRRNGTIENAYMKSWETISRNQSPSNNRE